MLVGPSVAFTLAPLAITHHNDATINQDNATGIAVVRT